MAVTRTALGLIALVAAVALALYLLVPAPDPVTQTQLTIGATTLAVDVADTDEERVQGLSGRPSLAEGTGLFFVFEEDSAWGIWMKDMRFPIDIIWADASGTIVTIAHEVSPETYPEVFMPTAPARYVLEVPAGYAKKAGIAEGQKIVI